MHFKRGLKEIGAQKSRLVWAACIKQMAGRCLIERLLGEYLLLAPGRDVVMILDFGLVARNLTIQFVGQLINSRIQIGM